MLIRNNALFQFIFLILIASVNLLARIQIKSVTIFLIASVLFLPLLTYKRDTPIKRKVFLIFTLLIIWSFVSTFWSQNVGLYPYSDIVLPLIMAFVTMFIPYMFTKLIHDKSGKQTNFLTLFNFLMAVIFIVYLYKYNFTVHYDSMGRFMGLMGGASVIHFVMVPVIAVFMTNFSEKRFRFLSLVGILIMLYCLFLTGSRGALITIMLYVAFQVLKNIKSIKKIILTLISISVVAFMVINYMPTDRYENINKDPLRTMNNETTMKLLLDTPETFLFGNGFGSIWPYYSLEKEPGFLEKHKNGTVNQNQYISSDCLCHSCTLYRLIFL
jgi:MFS family permease